ncbi:MAG: S8 family serine peptidase, partial [Rhizobiaceae bacterium]|nr:S8 family serine peptidase [Rhizobiaceae bacterium]
DSCRLAPTIGMIDTGVNPEHPSLAAGRVEIIEVLAEGRRAASRVHGTAVALLIAGDPDSRTPGMLPNARLIAAEAFHRTGSGEETADAFDVVRGIESLADRNVDIVNMSFSGPANLLLERAIAALAERKVPVVAAAGNAGPRSEPLFPAAYPQAIAVTAVDASNRVYRQANAGDHIAFAAPGVRLWTAASVSGGRFRSGTSYAAPFVTAALAIQRTIHPERPVAELVEGLASEATDLGNPGRDATFGHGLVKMPDCATAGSGGAIEALPVAVAPGEVPAVAGQPADGPSAQSPTASSPSAPVSP